MISGDTSIFTNTPSFLAHYNKNMSLVKFHVFNTSYNIYSILPANGGYLLSGYKYFLPVPNDFPVMWQSKINGDGTMIWEKEYKDTARYMNSSFMGQGLKIGNVYYNYGFNGINNENFRNIYAHLNAINENGDLILDKTYTQHTNFFFMKMVEKNNALYAVGRFDSMIHPDTSAQLVHFSKISPQTGKIEWYQLYKHWHYNTIWNLYNDSSGFMMCGTAVNPNRMEEFNANGVIDGDGWLLKVDTNGCIVPGCKPNVYSGIQHILRDNSLVEVYPNPVTDCFTVALKNNQLFNCESTLFIHDESGRELYNSAIKAQTRSIELKHAFGYSGVAYIVITNSNGTFYKKIVFK
ncbi:MAG: T9SS type A sorting domain-containing protein [Bacteroidota bacterium]